MMDYRQIVRLSEEQAARAAQAEKLPFVPTSQEIERWLKLPANLRLPFPNIGAYRPAGWVMIHDWLVDKSGFGSESEPALTLRGMINKIASGFVMNPRMGFAIVEEGEFQLVVGVFIPDPTAEGNADDFAGILERIEAEEAEDE